MMTQPVRLAARLAREFHGMLVGIRAAEREEDAAAFEAGLLEQQLGEPRARLGAPGGGHEAQLARLRLDGRAPRAGC